MSPLQLDPSPMYEDKAAFGLSPRLFCLFVLVRHCLWSLGAIAVAEILKMSLCTYVRTLMYAFWVDWVLLKKHLARGYSS